MKKIIIFITLLMVCGGCDLFNKNENNNIINETQQKANLIDSFDLELTNNNIDYEKNNINNTIGAKESYIYLFGDNSLNLFVFDTNSEEYKEIFKNGYIFVGDTAIEQEVIINEELVMYFSNTFSERQEIEAIFFNL